MTVVSNPNLRLAFSGMVGMAVAMGAGRFVFTPILPLMMEGLGLSPTDAGWIASANYLGYLVGAFAAAGAWGAGRERQLMLIALAASAVLAAVMGLTNSLTVFLIVRFLAGVASAFVMIFLASIVFSHLAASGQTHLQSIHFAGVGVGIAASSIMMAWLLWLQAPWQEAWFGASILSVAGFCFVALTVRVGPVQQAGESRAEPPLPRNPSLVRLIIAYGLFGFGYIVTATFLVAIVRQGDGGRIFEAIVWLVTGIAIIPSIHLWGKLAKSKGIISAYMVGCIVEAVGVAASVSIGGWVGPVLAGLLLGGTFVAVTAYGLQAGRLLAPQSPRRAFALMTAAFGVGQIIGPIVAGQLAHSTGSYFAQSLLAALVLLVSAAFVWPDRRTAS